MLEILSLLVCSLWQKRKLHINTDFAVTGWMLCVLPHIQKNVKYHSDIDHRKKINNLFKTLFHGLSVDKMAVTQDLFWNDYTLFDNKKDSFDREEFIWKSKDIRDGNSHL